MQNTLDAIIRTREDFLKKYFSHFICNVCVWEGVGDWTKTAIYWPPPLLWPSALCLSRSPDAQPEDWGSLCWLSLLHLITNWSGPQTPSGVPRAPSAGCGFPYHISSLTRLISNSIEGSERSLRRAVAFSTTSCLRRLWSPNSLTSCLHRVI